MNDVRLVPTRDAALWDCTVRAIPEHTQFHTWDWLELVQRLFDVRVDHLLVQQGARFVGVIPVVRDRAPALVARGMPFPYLGPLVSPAALGAALRAFRVWQIRHGVLLAVFDLPPMVDAEQLLRSQGASVRAASTIVVDLPEDARDLEAGYTTMRRRSLRRAERAGATARVSQPGEVTALLDGVLDQAYEARGVPSPYPAGSGALIERWMAGRDDVLALTALVDEEPAGVHLVLTGGPRALSWLVACDRRFREVGPNALLYHRALEHSVQRGFAQMDLVGRVDDGVARFKTSFGGREVPYLAADSFLGPRVLRRSARRAQPAARPAGREVEPAAPLG